MNAADARGLTILIGALGVLLAPRVALAQSESGLTPAPPASPVGGEDVAAPTSDVAPEASPAPGLGPAPEPIDVTRLDVERLPPEAIELDRDMFAVGPMVLAQIGGRGFAGGLGRLAEPGVLVSVGAGYGVASWFALSAQVEASIHRTSAPAPPAPGTFEVFDVLAEARLMLPVSARAGLWLAGQGGLGAATSDLLRLYGLEDADKLGPLYGGALGFDWHMLSRHHALGLLVGARMQPNLDRADERSIAIHSAAYLNYSL